MVTCSPQPTIGARNLPAEVNQPQILLADEPTGNLGFRTGAEILKEFQRIKRERGQTIVMVTHDPAIAAYAPRQITVRDGLIASDVSNGGAASGGLAAGALSSKTASPSCPREVVRCSR